MLTCFACRLEDVGKPKAEVAAKRVMERISGVQIVPHFCRIEDKEIEFYNDFSIIALGLDSVEARSYINTVACSFLGVFCFSYLSLKLLRIFLLNNGRSRAFLVFLNITGNHGQITTIVVAL